MPLYEAHRAFVLGSRVVHAAETPIALLDPGGGKTKKAYMWAYARGAFEPEPGVVFDFCAGRGGKYPLEFLKGWGARWWSMHTPATTSRSPWRDAAPRIALRIILSAVLSGIAGLTAWVNAACKAK